MLIQHTASAAWHILTEKLLCEYATEFQVGRLHYIAIGKICNIIIHMDRKYLDKVSYIRG